jgi:hypothetical protein
MPKCHCFQGWICEAHTDRAWPHDDCAGPGMRCENSACGWWRGPSPAALNTDDWALIERHDRATRKQPN